jgi:hypothetical protein
VSTPDLADWQLQLGDLVLGPGTPYEYFDLTGLDELPDLRTDDTPRPGGHGEFTGIDYASGRTVEMTLEVAAEPALAVTYQAALAALRVATVPATDGARTPFWFRLPGQPVLRLDMKVRRRRIPTDRAYEMGLASPQLQLRAASPFATGTDRTASASLPSSSSGMAFPMAFPMTFGAGGSTGRVVMTNAGTAPASVLYTVLGPLEAGFELVEVATGRRLVYVEALTATDVVVLDSALGTVMLNGTAPRRSKLTRAQWWQVPAGGTCIVQINPLGTYQAAASLAAGWADTYWL